MRWKAAVDKQAWDDSVKALASTPDVLAHDERQIDWAKNLGDAGARTAASDVMDAVRRLRARVAARKQTSSSHQQQKVSVQRSGEQDVISSNRRSLIRFTFLFTIPPTV